MNRALTAAMILLLMAAPAGAGTWIHGIVQDAAYQPVAGGTVRIDHEHNGQWYKERETVNMQSHAFGWTLTKAGNYRVSYEQDGYEVAWIRNRDFTLDTAPAGDIQINVRRVAAPTATRVPVPTTLMPPTVDPTATGTPAPCPSFQQFTWAERRSIIATAASYIGRELETQLEWHSDLTLIHGLNEQLLGAPVTIKFIVMGLTARGFCNGILVMRPVSRLECYDYGVVGWDGTQNWE